MMEAQLKCLCEVGQQVRDHLLSLEKNFSTFVDLTEGEKEEERQRTIKLLARLYKVDVGLLVPLARATSLSEHRLEHRQKRRRVQTPTKELG